MGGVRGAGERLFCTMSETLSIDSCIFRASDGRGVGGGEGRGGSEKGIFCFWVSCLSGRRCCLRHNLPCLLLPVSF